MDLILFYSQNVLELYKDKKKFVLIGHSFGAVLGIKLAKILEQAGKLGEVICADGAVALFKQGMHTHIPQRETMDESVQHFILTQLVFEMLPEMGLDEIQKVLNEKKTFEERADTFIEMVPKSEYSKTYLKNFGYGLSNRMKMILNESDDCAGERIHSNITLIRPKTQNLIPNIPNDYDLNKYTRGQMTVNYVEGNHLTMLDNAELYSMVNVICTNKMKS